MNREAIDRASKIIESASYQIALPAMIKRKLTRCCTIMKVKAVK